MLQKKFIALLEEVIGDTQNLENLVLVFHQANIQDFIIFWIYWKGGKVDTALIASTSVRVWQNKFYRTAKFFEFDILAGKEMSPALKLHKK